MERRCAHRCRLRYRQPEPRRRGDRLQRIVGQRPEFTDAPLRQPAATWPELARTDAGCPLDRRKRHVGTSVLLGAQRPMEPLIHNSDRQLCILFKDTPWVSLLG